MAIKLSKYIFWCIENYPCLKPFICRSVSDSAWFNSTIVIYYCFVQYEMSNHLNTVPVRKVSIFPIIIPIVDIYWPPHLCLLKWTKKWMGLEFSSYRLGGDTLLAMWENLHCVKDFSLYCSQFIVLPCQNWSGAYAKFALIFTPCLTFNVNVNLFHLSDYFFPENQSRWFYFVLCFASFLCSEGFVRLYLPQVSAGVFKASIFTDFSEVAKSILPYNSVAL